MTSVSRLTLVPAACALAVLTACGGGDGDSTSNRAPIAAADAVTVAWNAPSAPIDVLANDSDPDNDAFTLVSATQPAHGSAKVEAGKVIYTPQLSYMGPDQFTYTIRDTFGVTATGTVAITVQAQMKLTGRVVGLAESVVTGNVGTETFTVTADGDGKFQLPVTATSPDAFMTLSTQGSGEQATVKLRSLVGQVSTFVARATNLGDVVDNGFDSVLQLGSLSTARAALATAANGGSEPTTQAALDDANTHVDGAALLQRAATIRRIMAGNLALPAGVPDTAALVADEAAFAALMRGVLNPDPNALEPDISGVRLDASQTVPFPTTVAAATTLWSFSGSTDDTSAVKLTLNPDATATLAVEGAPVAAKWAVVNGILTVTPNAPFTLVLTDPTAGTVTASVKALTWRRHVGGPLRSHVSWQASYTYISDTGATVSGTGYWHTNVMLDATLLGVPTAEELVAQPYAGMLVPNAMDASVMDADTLTLKADGTGTMARTGTAVTWTRTDTALTLRLPGGTEYAVVRGLADASGLREQWLMQQTKTPVGGAAAATAVFNTTMVKVQPTLVFGADTAGKTWLYGGGPGWVVPNPLAYAFLAGGTGEYRIGYAATVEYPFAWLVQPAGDLNMKTYVTPTSVQVSQCPVGVVCVLVRDRTWTKVAVAGARTYVMLHQIIRNRDNTVATDTYVVRALDALTP